MRRRLCPKEALFTPSFIAVCSANLLFFIASFMMVPVLPIYLLDGLHASKSVVGIILSAYMIGALVMRPISGFLADQFPRKMLFLVCGILFAAQFEGYLLFNALALVGIVRALHGMSFGALSTSAATLAVDVIPIAKLGTGIGLYGMMGSLAMALGPMIGMLVLEAGSYDAVFITAMGCAAGGIAGLITGLIHVKCRVRDLLSGIITMTGLYSINLHIAQNKANLPLFGGDTLFRNAFTKSLPKAISPYTTLIIIFLIALIAKILLDLFLRTKCGYLLRAAGDNPSVVTTLSRDQGTVKILGLIIANALVALAGAVMCQQQRFFDISMGTGTMVAGLASVIIGTNLFRHASFLRTTTMVLIGSILYKACVSIAISFGLDAQDMKLITAVLFLAILVLSNTRKKKVRIHA